jgi:arsenate reductase (thioredoxin)
MSKLKPTVLILCTGNSCRSHLAEGILRAAAGDSLNVQSAGSKPAGYVHPLAIQVMKEIGIDISAHRSKHMNDFLEQNIETVITVCGNADQACPIFPGQLNRYHWWIRRPGTCHGHGRREVGRLPARSGRNADGIRGLRRWSPRSDEGDRDLKDKRHLVWNLFL